MLSRSLSRCIRPRIPRIARCLSVSNPTENMRWGYLVKRRIDHFEMGGKIGIETLLDNEKFFLAELIAYSSKF